MKMFPVMDAQKYPESPKEIPFPIVAAHGRQAQINHYQTVQRLAERGGLLPCELVAVLEDRAWRRMEPQAAIERLLTILDDLYVCVGCEQAFHLPCASVVNLSEDHRLRFCVECTRDANRGNA